ncbi:hypothetical protein B0T14DRAFT_300066 [Immersiella caudata]|uniref:Uncharacterized protein n=1 Tax=Immersiella caudata TaxID=314043 RepID=A0AA39WF52_9PEZI|nr:hypothetical protein B0T14DRAFT_300066 [Immersiella caudata]
MPSSPSRAPKDAKNDLKGTQPLNMRPRKLTADMPAALPQHIASTTTPAGLQRFSPNCPADQLESKMTQDQLPHTPCFAYLAQKKTVWLNTPLQATKPDCRQPNPLGNLKHIVQSCPPPQAAYVTCPYQITPYHTQHHTTSGFLAFLASSSSPSLPRVGSPSHLHTPLRSTPLPGIRTNLTHPPIPEPPTTFSLADPSAHIRPSHTRPGKKHRISSKQADANRRRKLSMRRVLVPVPRPSRPISRIRLHKTKRTWHASQP